MFTSILLQSHHLNIMSVANRWIRIVPTITKVVRAPIIYITLFSVHYTLQFPECKKFSDVNTLTIYPDCTFHRTQCSFSGDSVNRLAALHHYQVRSMCWSGVISCKKALVQPTPHDPFLFRPSLYISLLWLTPKHILFHRYEIFSMKLGTMMSATSIFKELRDIIKTRVTSAYQFLWYKSLQPEKLVVFSDDFSVTQGDTEYMTSSVSIFKTWSQPHQFGDHIDKVCCLSMSYSAASWSRFEGSGTNDPGKFWKGDKSGGISQRIFLLWAFYHPLLSHACCFHYFCTSFVVLIVAQNLPSKGLHYWRSWSVAGHWINFESNETPIFWQHHAWFCRRKCSRTGMIHNWADLPKFSMMSLIHLTIICLGWSTWFHWICHHMLQLLAHSAEPFRLSWSD